MENNQSISGYKNMIFFTVVLLITMSSFHCQPETSAVHRIMTLPLGVDESSGLALTPGGLYTINDGGNGSFIFRIDTLEKKVTARVKIIGAKNRDWEDMSYSDGKVYISDTGNNAKNRKKMQLYIIEDSILQQSSDKITDFEVYEFKFVTKKGKTKRINCEAMTVEDGMAYFFSKETDQTEIYALNLDGKEEEAKKITTIDINFRITGITKLGDGHYLACGYDKYGNQIYYSDLVDIRLDPETGWEKSTWKKIGKNFAGQCEGIESNGNQIILSTESNDFTSSGLFSMEYP